MYFNLHLIKERPISASCKSLSDFYFMLVRIVTPSPEDTHFGEGVFFFRTDTDTDY